MYVYPIDPANSVVLARGTGGWGIGGGGQRNCFFVSSQRGSWNTQGEGHTELPLSEGRLLQDLSDS